MSKRTSRKGVTIVVGRIGCALRWSPATGGPPTGDPALVEATTSREWTTWGPQPVSRMRVRWGKGSTSAWRAMAETIEEVCGPPIYVEVIEADGSEVVDQERLDALLGLEPFDPNVLYSP